MLTHEDKELLAKKGISEEKIAEQLACFEKGFPFLKLSAAASVENGGIMKAEAITAAAEASRGVSAFTGASKSQ